MAELWLKAADPSAVTSAFNEIDRMLEADPLGCGESRVANLRILFE